MVLKGKKVFLNALISLQAAHDGIDTGIAIVCNKGKKEREGGG